MDACSGIKVVQDQKEGDNWVQIVVQFRQRVEDGGGVWTQRVTNHGLLSALRFFLCRFPVHPNTKADIFDFDS